MHNNPIIHAMIAAFLAIGTAVSEDTLQRAGKLLRELIADDVVDAATVGILESFLVAVDAEKPVAPALDTRIFAALGSPALH
jgi:hypothetical protein